MSDIASLYSIFMSNIDPVVVEAQAQVVNKFLPIDWVFEQRQVPLRRYAHADAMKDCITHCTTDVIAFLDIDCIPLTSLAPISVLVRK